MVEAPEHVVSAPLLARTEVSLSVKSPASRVQVAFATLPGLLYRISTPGDSGLRPVASTGPRGVEVRLRQAGGEGPDDVRVVLNPVVRWRVSLPAGAGEEQLDLSQGRVRSVELGAAGMVELRLPEPSGTLPVTLGAGVGRVALVTGGAPARLDLHGGAGDVQTPWGGGPRTAGPFQAAGWATARNRYSVSVRAAVTAVTLQAGRRVG